MTSSTLFKAILAMDAYNRGYEAAIELSDAVNVGIGTATIQTNSSLIFEENADQAIGFYSIAYNYDNEIVISFRGTNDFKGLSTIASSLDAYHGWSIGAGNTASEQGLMAIEFYQAVAGAGNWLTADISLTGHSLGGGLAGYVGAICDQDATIFDSMTFELAAGNALGRAENYSVQWRNTGEEGYFTDVVTPEELATLQATVGVDVISYSLVDEAFRSFVYGSETPWDIDLDGIEGHYMEGEFLGTMLFLRGGVAEMNPYNLGYDDNFSGFELHDAAALIIRMYAEDPALVPAANNWEAAAEYFWPVLYSDGFAARMDSYSTATGQLYNEYKWSQIARSALAYSAIHDDDLEDSEDYTLVFGDTGIVSLYNDANDFGTALLNGEASSVLGKEGEGISKAFVQYSALFALRKIEQANVAGAVDGILSLTSQLYNKALTEEIRNEI